MRRYICIRKNSLYRTQYHPWFQTSPGVLGTYPPQTSGDDCNALNLRPQVWFLQGMISASFRWYLDSSPCLSVTQQRGPGSQKPSNALKYLNSVPWGCCHPACQMQTLRRPGSHLAARLRNHVNIGGVQGHMSSILQISEWPSWMLPRPAIIVNLHHCTPFVLTCSLKQNLFLRLLSHFNLLKSGSRED